MPARLLEQIDLTVDEVEALRLTDVVGLSQEQAATRLGVSRQTVGRVLDSAHRKVADALVNGKALAIGGGPYRLTCRAEDEPAVASDAAGNDMKRADEKERHGNE